MLSACLNSPFFIPFTLYGSNGAATNFACPGYLIEFAVARLPIQLQIQSAVMRISDAKLNKHDSRDFIDLLSD